LNAIVTSSDLQVIKNYVKNIKNIILEDVQIPRLPQLKPYLKIIEISYFRDDTNLLITPDVVESIIKSNYIFNNLLLASRPRIIKAFLKSDITIV